MQRAEAHALARAAARWLWQHQIAAGLGLAALLLAVFTALVVGATQRAAQRQAAMAAAPAARPAAPPALRTASLDTAGPMRQTAKP